MKNLFKKVKNLFTKKSKVKSFPIPRSWKHVDAVDKVLNKKAAAEFKGFVDCYNNL